MSNASDHHDNKALFSISLLIFVSQFLLVGGALYLTREALFKFISVMAYSKWRPLEQLQGDFLLGVGFSLLATFLIIIVRFIILRLTRSGRFPYTRLLSLAALVAAIGVASSFVYKNFEFYSQDDQFFGWQFTGERAYGHFPFDPEIVKKSNCLVESAENPCEQGTCLVSQLIEVPCFNKELNLSFQWENRFGYVMKAHVNPDGTRRCSPSETENTGKKTVLFVGDSFVYGVGLKDHDSICWQVRERMNASRPGAFQFINLGQAGANIFSYADNIRYGIKQFKPSVVFVGILITDDAQPFDVNLHYAASRWLPFQIGASILEPHILLDAITIFFDFSFSEFVVSHIIRKGVNNIAAIAEEEEVPIALYVYEPTNDPTDGHFRFYSNLLHQAAEKSPHVFSLGEIYARSTDEETYIPGDGHPTSLGNRLLAAHFEEGLAQIFPVKEEPNP